MDVVDFGGGAGEGLAAVRGYQSGDQGVRVEIPVFSPGDRSYRASIVPLPGTNSFFISGTRDACPYRGGALGERALPIGGMKDAV